MPAPLGSVPTRRMPRITVHGSDDSAATRNAIRFFRERRVVVTVVDVRTRPFSAAEIRRLVEQLGAAALIDSDGRAFAESGLPAPTEGGQPPGIVGRLLAEPRLLRLPIVRFGDMVTAGKAEETWREWLARPR